MYVSAAKHDLNSLALRRSELSTRERRIRSLGSTTCIAILRCGIGAIRLEPPAARSVFSAALRRFPRHASATFPAMG
jgi:hypothetical protein